MHTERPVHRPGRPQDAVGEEADERSETHYAIDDDGADAAPTSTHGTDEDDEPGEAVGRADIPRERGQTGQPRGDEQQRERRAASRPEEPNEHDKPERAEADHRRF